MRYPAHTLDSNRYAETFSVFVSRSLEYGAMQDRLAETVGKSPLGLDCLDVGAGTGMMIRDWLSIDGPRPGRYVAIEPNAVHAAQLRDSIAELELDGTVLATPFHGEFPQPGRFDLILFSHSLYWMTDPIACVRRAHGWLEAGGVLLVFLQGPFGFHSLFHQFDPLLDRSRPADVNHGYSSHELIQGLRSHGLCPRVTYDPTAVDLTGMFDTGLEAERDEFLSFVLQVEFAQLAEPIKSDVIQCLRAGCFEKGGRVLWHHPTVTVQIHCEQDRARPG